MCDSVVDLFFFLVKIEMLDISARVVFLNIVVELTLLYLFKHKYVAGDDLCWTA